jgi:hypothetical protein
MIKIYVEKNNEIVKGEIDRNIITFDNHKDLTRFLTYNEGYIIEIKTLDSDSTYSFTDVNGVTISDLN